ncbi:MAG: DUF2130 domain-containing protein [Candidatus Levybacteria bacterium]|nr:DUF2130 domain-containing protein [Candidatus Levybacteria bacterium]MBP9814806.1 DUF2130 domain-containing protein [Candidatus Levybacteria bacterium]
MQNTFLCPHCKNQIELTEALKHEFQEDFEKDIEKAKTETEEKVRKKLQSEQELILKDSENEKSELRDQNMKLQESLLELNKSLRNLKTKDEERELEMEKKLASDTEKIRVEVTKKAEEEQRLKILEKDKQLSDTLKELEDARRKLQQGSQQTQGEAFELEFEEKLKHEFPNDTISEVAKGTRGGDIIQEVTDRNGNICGKILWELKNTKAWSEPWIDKLKSDQRSITAEYAVLISEAVPADVESAKFHKGVWIVKHEFVMGLAYSLRLSLVQIAMAKRANEGKQEKMDILYTYLSGTEFKHRVEAIIEAFTNMQTEIEKEKRYFANKWSRDEKNIRQVVDNTFGMQGDLKGIMGSALPDIKGVEMLDDGKLSDN